MVVTKQNCKSVNIAEVANADKVISFEQDITNDIMLDVLNSLNNIYENDIFIDIKPLSIDRKIAILNWALAKSDLKINPIILNILNLVKTYNELAPEYFANKNVIFNDIEEFLDIKTELKEQLQQFIDAFAIWYFSIFASVHKLEQNIFEEQEDVPPLYSILILLLDFYTLSGICAKANFEKINKLKVVKNAIAYVE